MNQPSTASPIELRAQISAWPLAAVFTISRGSKTQADVVVVEVERAGIVGQGECVPYARYDESIQSVLAQIHGVSSWLSQQTQAGSARAALSDQLPAGAARNALDCALIDLQAKSENRRAWDLLGCAAPSQVTTAYTLSLDSPERMGASAAAHADRPLLKLKLDRELPIERVRAVREAAPAATLIVDANEAWTPGDLAEWLPAMHALGVAMVEQPLPAGDDAALIGLDSPVVLGADESCHVASDIPKLVDRYQMVNIKLDKSGGLTEALTMREAAIAAGLQFMVGCMVGTSLSMAPATLVTPGARFVDLDGPLLMASDRANGLNYHGSEVSPPTAALWG